MYHTMTIAGVQRDLPICKVSDDLYIGAFVIFGDVELTVKTAEALLKKAPEYDYMISAEAKGIPLIYEMARQSGQNKYFLARKAPKLYMSGVFDVKVNSITTAKEQHLYLDKADAELMRGKRILIVDDVISTGESLAAVEKLVAAPVGFQDVDVHLGFGDFNDVGKVHALFVNRLSDNRALQVGVFLRKFFERTLFVERRALPPGVPAV